ncbi:dynein-related subfamily AAA family protein [Malaciobacter marinus]|uniref:Dynein-related subfamily AAA family protein n=1 Tax=Malaciobacter marinus TaxID=505249 RepID=A0AB36ZXC3_9BACT|nr:AAA family ATPase [Malaciobacter marinus]PPK61823.1 dynein-related subfamily AAA family protein [Malaciobacter marinus]
MINQNVYNQIDSFVEQRVGKQKLHEIKFYVDSETAKDKASFIKFLVDNNEIIEKGKDYKTIDLCYGSGNLTTHILGDSSIDFSELVLNDVNIDDRNNGIQIGTKQDDDFLDATKFTTKYDLIVFNPQIGGKETYSKGIVEFEKIEPIIYNNTFEDYLISQGIDISLFDISVDESEKSILVYSDDMTKSQMNEVFKNIKIFNYYDVFYKSKTWNTEGKTTKIVQFRKTLENISHENSIVIFYGEMNYFKYLFADYTNIRFYLQDSGKQLFVLAKGESSKKCYQKKENQFIENKNCEIEKSSDDDEDLDIGELMQELEENKTENNYSGFLQSESLTITSVQNDNEEKFKQWWYANTKALNSYNEPLDQKTKNAYYNGLKRFSNEVSLNIFIENNIEKLSMILKSLEKDGENYEYNKKEGYNPSNGLKQYIKFLSGESNKDEILNNNQEYTNLGKDKLLEFSNESKGKENWEDDFKYKNILFKGVPGTGKSETIKNIIIDKLNMKRLADNVLRINIHSASSNSDLMQGISISTTKDNENVLYREKQGAILNHIFKAIYKPKQPFVLVLEEIQENSLNELIGDLIYLIEDKKRTIVDLDIPNNTKIAYDELFEKLNKKAREDDKSLDYVELPSLVENSQNNTKMIVPDNLFIFCTSNYRDDKKVIEDNLLRRFDVIEIYPKYKDIYKSDDIPKFLEKLNDEILKQFKDETHPDRYLIGHANWLDIKEEENEDNLVLFYKALLKVIIEFKEIREIDFDSEVKPILEKVFKDIILISDRLDQYLKIFYNDDKLELKSYKNIVDILQKKIYKSFL